MTIPFYSVVIPLYNKSPFIARTLAHVLAQDDADFEVLVVDDGSSDGGDMLIAACPDPRVRLVRQPNAGPGAARNRGAAEATGQWIALLDADDLWRPNHLSILRAAAEALPGVDLIGTVAERISARDVQDVLASRVPVRSAREIDYFAEGLHGQTLHTSAVAIRRTAYLASRGFGSASLGEDTEFWARFALDYRIARVDEPTVVYLRDNGGLMDMAIAGEPVRAVNDAPAVETLRGAMADPRHAHRHAAMQSYIDRCFVGAARRALAVGDTVSARALLGRIEGHSVAHRRWYWLLARMPGRWLGSAMGARRRIARLSH